ncbi:adenosine deaminase family protein [Streptomyces violens]|uniref:adenosine deaminase family protein n=1 Tax=Streptomyces violens TaxID=66377 RepID=UPI000A538069
MIFGNRLRRSASAPRPKPTPGPGLRAVLALLGAASLGAAALPAVPDAAATPPPAGRPTTPAEQRVDAHLDAIRHDPRALRAFMRALPKGGDLHNHLTGAASTELLVRLAAQDGLCIDRTDTALPPPCRTGTRPAADTRTDPAFRQRLIRAWSMQDLPPGASGHDHFFAAFDKFDEVTERHTGELLADVTGTAAAHHQSYLETMITPAAPAARRLAADVGYDSDLSRMHRELLAGGKLDRVVRDARREADRATAVFRRTAHCDTHAPAPGCRVTVRFISQAIRAEAPEQVFTQLAVGMRLAERDRRFVAVNLVAPEDGETALRDYRLHMRMLDYLHGVYPHAHITLHAGELTPGLVKPADLRFHIREAVHTGHAERIGHGVDLAHEDGAEELLRTMAHHGIALESPLTSNAQILGVSGDDHPFQRYRRAGVPVTLATDDPGISRTDISHEYQRAATTYHLSYPELKDLARTSLEQAFLPGPRKAHLQWRLENAFHRFEQRELRGH